VSLLAEGFEIEKKMNYVRYTAGPYGELLFMPGRVTLEGKILPFDPESRYIF
jgi:hypothetical protein